MTEMVIPVLQMSVFDKTFEHFWHWGQPMKSNSTYWNQIDFGRRTVKTLKLRLYLKTQKAHLRQLSTEQREASKKHRP